MTGSTRPTSRPHRRSGLAPLELVLSVPLMLLVMALIVNFGTISAWKVRTQTNARYAGWRTRELRTGEHNPRPVRWPASAALNSGAGRSLDAVNSIWNGIPGLRSPAVRGPVLGAPGSPSRIPVERRLEMSDGAHRGSAVLQRTPPLLDHLFQEGRFRFDLAGEFLDRRWEFHDLGFGNNRSRRAKQWYRLEPEDFAGLTGLLARVRLAHGRLREFPRARDLDPLDRDPEFIAYTGRAPDFHQPRITGCEADPAVFAAGPRFREFLDGIMRKPGRMGRAFIDLYRDQIERLRNADPPPPNRDQQIAELQRKIEQLQRFRDALPREHR